MFTDIISVSELSTLMSSGANRSVPSSLILFDCSFDLSNSDKGLTEYNESHIKGALYASLNENLSAHDSSQAINGGRHPLPRREIFAQWLGQMGVTQQSQVVVYDRQGNNFCGRLWWMLKWCGLDSVAVLDGGLKAWIQSGGELESRATSPSITPAQFELKDSIVPMLSIDALKAELEQSADQLALIDARAAARYRGEVEPLDPVAGHIPGALNRPFNTNFTEQGLFKSKDELRAEFGALLSGKNPQRIVHQCGSGVSAVPNLIAMHIAGFGYTHLYPGSWSEWSRVRGAAVEKN
jgi:thiosulfate/3-mercaptopyruvate sulfurtransferase